MQKVGGGYGIDEKGKALLKAFTPVPTEMGFHFYYSINQPIDFSAQTLEEFYTFIKQVRVDSIEFHLYRSDFENWLKQTCKEPELAKEVGRIKVAGLKGEDLRKELLRVIDAKYDIQKLL